MNKRLQAPELERAEKHAHAAEKRLQLITDNIPMLVGYIDSGHVYRFNNKNYESWLGIPLSSITGRPVREVVGEKKYELMRPHIESGLSGKTNSLRSYIESAGTLRHVETTYIPDYDEARNVVGVLVLTSDIEQLTQVEGRLNMIADNMPALICYIDRDQVYRFNNKLYETWHGVDRSQITGKSMREVMGDEAYARVRPAVEKALSGEIAMFERVIERKAVTNHVRGTYIPDRDENGAVRGIYGLTYDVTIQKEIEAELVRLARFDTLTGLANRSYFNERLAEDLARSRRSGKPPALLYLDIDKFKRINDTMGHNAGDAILEAFGQRLKRTLRTTDFCARLGGDEFTVILDGPVNEAGLTVMARKILSAMAEPVTFGEDTVAITTSIGIAVWAGAAETAEVFVKRADSALYAAKVSGRNKFHFAPEPEIVS